MKAAMRIIFGVTVPESFRLLGLLPQMLNDAGWDVHLTSHPGPLPSTFAGKDLPFHGIPITRTPSLAKDFHALVLWVALIRKLKPKMVVVGTPKASLLGLIAARTLQVPRRIYVLRGLRLETTFGLSRWVLWVFERLSSHLSTHVLAVSHSLARKYVDLGLCSSEKITVLGSGSSHGVDVERFQPRPIEEIEPLRSQLGLATGVPVLGFAGRFSRDKGANALLATRNELLESNIDHEILLLGSIEGSRSTLEKLNAKGRPVKFVADATNIEDYYQLMTVLLLPTKREGFPNVVLEAGASGVPTVSTSVTGTVDAIVHNVTGFLVKSHSDKAFANTVKVLINEPETLAEAGRAARRRTAEKFVEAEVCARYVNFLKEITL